MKGMILLLLLANIFSNCSSINNQDMIDMDGRKGDKNVTVLDSINVHYKDEGKGGETLLFIHGLGSNLKAFDKMVSAFQDDFRCVSIDLPGYNKSSKGHYTFKMTFFAQIVKEVIQELDLKRVTVVGHSMGGHIGIKIALSDGFDIERMVLLSPAGFETFSEKESAFLKQVSTPRLFKSLTEEQIIKNFKDNFYEFPQDAQFMIDDRLEMVSNEVKYDYYCNMIPLCISGMLDEPVYASLNKVDIPTLVIYGEQDELIPNRYLHSSMSTVEVAKSGASVMGNSRLSIVKDGGHFFFWEKADDTHAIIKEFLTLDKS